MKRVLALTLAAVSLTPPAAAWTPETRVAMVDQAVRLLPESLSRALGGQRRELLEGMLDPLTRDTPDRRPAWDGGTLEQALSLSVAELEGGLAQPTPFSEIATRMGRLAHYVFEAGFPPGVSRTDGESRYTHFAAFCDSRRVRFPLVFYGHEDQRLAERDYTGFALEIIRRASDDDRELARAYAAAGNPPRAAAFDDRSIPFAIGSLAYSRSINDLVRVWLDTWSRAGGDMARTPYRSVRPVSAAPEDR